MKKPILLLFVLFAAFTCEDDDDNLPEDISIVTGILIRGEDGAPLNPATSNFDEKNNKLGNPNVRNEKTFVFPNPGKSQVFIRSDKKIEKMWLLKGDVNKDFKQTDFTNLLANYQYNATEIAANSEKEFAPNVAEFALKIDDFSPGYYRVFYAIENDSIRWDNLYIYQEDTFWKALDKVKRDW